MKVTVHAVVMLAGATLCAIFFFRDAMSRSSELRWYDRVIRFLGALLLLTVAVVGLLLLTGKIASK